jgi:hypothetical protein
LASTVVLDSKLASTNDPAKGANKRVRREVFI